MKERSNFIDNIRWVTVLSVLAYHVFYNFNAEGVFGGFGGFSDVQYQDVILYMLNPWFMTLMFLVAGISSRYSLERRGNKEFIRSRTLKLLVPSTIGLFVFQWMLGYINIKNAGVLDSIPVVARYPVMAINGIGPLWFIQELWFYSLLLVLIRMVFPGRRLDAFFDDVHVEQCNGCSRKERCASKGYCVGHQSMLCLTLMVGGFLLLWGAAQSQIDKVTLDNATPLLGLVNLYRPLFYIVPFLLGYYVFARESVQDALARWHWPLLVLAVAAMLVFVLRYFGKDYTSPDCLQGVWNNLFAWLMVLAMLSCFKVWGDRTTPFATYMTRSSFGIYVVHMLVCSATAYYLKSSLLPVWSIYVLTLLSTFLVSPLLYEFLRRIPLLRWCVLGINKRKSVKRV